MERVVISGTTEVMMTKLDMRTPFEVLYKSDVWIGDTGLSSHSIYNTWGAMNKRQCGSVSLGNAGKAVKATTTINVSSQFVTQDITLGLHATLTGVSYNQKLNST
jgi:hypothetical protein